MRSLLHIDMNACYASIECLYDPSIRNLPVAVGGDVEARHGIILAKSQIAKRFGVKTGDWFYDAVAYVYSNGLMDGTSATTFEPNANMTRAMVWAILARIDGETVTGANWIDTARAWAMAEGVSDGTDPNGLVTREQFATMLWRYAGEPASSYSLAKFTDNASVSDWASTAMSWAVEKGIITGVTESTLVPQGHATRAQCAAMLMRFAEL